mmetsp:Transcript_19074/g.44580  ORF Transcript_19074/g.44580 Transcript_19074/m.44580 type:complete len:117 (+) Transcript_19074:1467-1817(+)
MTCTSYRRCWATPSQAQRTLELAQRRLQLRSSTGLVQVAIPAQEASTLPRPSNSAGLHIERSFTIMALFQQDGLVYKVKGAGDMAMATVVASLNLVTFVALVQWLRSLTAFGEPFE